VTLVQRNMETFGRLFARYHKWTQNMRGLCGVRLDGASIAGGVKMTLKALDRDLTDFNIKQVRDGDVKLRQLGRIMTGSIALCCEGEPCVFELNNLRVSHFETAGGEPSKLGKMYALLEVSPGASNDDLRHACRQQSAEYDVDVVWDIQWRIVDAEKFLLSQPKDLYEQQLSTLFNDKRQQLSLSILQKVL